MWVSAHQPYKGSPSSKRRWRTKKEALEMAKRLRGKSTFKVNVYNVKK